MQQMIINGRAVQVADHLTVYEAAQAAGIDIPVLCHRDGLHPSGGCGVCTVEDLATGRLLPSCASRADAAMRIETDTERVRAQRRIALELLLSNHPADCEAPCQMACPSGLPVPEMMRLVADGQWEAAETRARQYPITCEQPLCEKACRRKPLGGAVAICAIHRLLAGGTQTATVTGTKSLHTDKVRFRSRMTLPDEALLALAREKGARTEWTEGEAFTSHHAQYEGARCLQCGCLKPGNCRLRDLCAATGARQAAFAGERSAIVRDHDGRGFAFDSSRCVLCGICVRTAATMKASIAPTFQGRGFGAQITPPLGRTWGDVAPDVLATCAAACPTGAMHA